MLKTIKEILTTNVLDTRLQESALTHDLRNDVSILNSINLFLKSSNLSDLQKDRLIDLMDDIYEQGVSDSRDSLTKSW